MPFAQNGVQRYYNYSTFTLCNLNEELGSKLNLESIQSSKTKYVFEFH